jgi:hypothetical protein
LSEAELGLLARLADRGKPKKSFDHNVKPKKCDVRLTEDEVAMLNKLADKNDLTKSDVMRKGLHLLYSTYIKKE